MEEVPVFRDILYKLFAMTEITPNVTLGVIGRITLSVLESKQTVDEPLIMISKECIFQHASILRPNHSNAESNQMMYL